MGGCHQRRDGEAGLPEAGAVPADEVVILAIGAPGLHRLDPRRRGPLGLQGGEEAAGHEGLTHAGAGAEDEQGLWTTHGRDIGPVTAKGQSAPGP